MSGGRKDLVARILDSGSALGGEPVTALVPAIDAYHDRLRRAGLRPGCVVVLQDMPGRDLFAATLAVWQLDAVPLPCQSRPDLPVSRSFFVLGDDLQLPDGDPIVAGLDLTAVLHTSSGTTDRPKIVKRGLASVLAEAEGYRVRLPMAAPDRALVPIPLAHSYGWGFATSALINGCAVDVEPLVRVSRLARKVDSGPPAVLALTPPVARLLADTRSNGPTTGLRVAMIGAGQVSTELDAAFAERFGIPLARGYGSSETGATFIGAFGIGQPIPGVEIAHPAPGERGELRIRTAAPVEGYLAEPGPACEEWSTGDIVERDAAGDIHFVERLRPGLRVNARFVDASALERLLRAIPGVDDVFLLTMARPAASEFEDLHAVVAGAQIDAAGLDRCLSNLPDGMPTPRVTRCPVLPVNTIGKPDRDKLRALVAEGSP